MSAFSSTGVPTAPTQPVARSGVVLVGVVMVFFGYMTANLFCLNELFPGALPPPYNSMSPLHALLGVSYLGWPVYWGATMLAVAGLVCVGSQPWSPAFAVVYVFCPVVGAGYLLWAPLRNFRRAFVADLYTFIGAGLAAGGAGGGWLALDGRSPVHPSIAGLMLQFGTAALIAGILRSRTNVVEEAATNTSAAVA